MAIGEGHLRRLPAEDVRPLRRSELRPDRPPEECVYSGDDAAETLHLGAFVDGALVGVASVFREDPPWGADPTAWRLRGVAVLPAARRGGHGAALVAECMRHARERGGRLLWFNARAGAIPFYRRLGFVGVGEEVELPHVGRHLRMRGPLAE